MTVRDLRFIAAALFMLALGAGSLALAVQSGAGRDRQRGADREQVRIRLQRALDGLREREAALEDAIRLLDGGAPLERVRARAMDTFDRDDRRDRAAPRADAPPGFHGDGRLDPDEVPRLMELLRRANPELRQRLERLRERDPQEMRRHLRRAAPRLRELIRLRLDDPAAFELKMDEVAANRDILRSAMRYALARRDGDQEQAERLEQQLRENVGRMFELRIRQQEHRLEKMTARLHEARAEIDRLRENREDLIDDRLEEVVDRVMQRSEEFGRRDAHDR